MAMGSYFQKGASCFANSGQVGVAGAGQDAAVLGSGQSAVWCAVLAGGCGSGC